MAITSTFQPEFEFDYDDTLPLLHQYSIPVMQRTIYNKMRALFRVKHGYSQRARSWIGPGYHGLLIYGLVRKLLPRSVVDVGTCWGFSALCAALAMEDARLNSQVLTIDRSEHTDYGSDAFFDRLRRDKVFQVVGLSKQQLPQYAPVTIDLAFVDGGHSYEQVHFDATFLSRRLSPNGILMLDDCVAEYAGVEQAAREIEYEFGLTRTTFRRIAMFSSRPFATSLTQADKIGTAQLR